MALGIKITRIGKNLESIIDEQGILPSSRIRFCTKYSKIFPMNDYIGKGQAICYFGLRSDEPDRVGALETKKLIPRYPLREAGIGLATVYRMLESRDLRPPTFLWNRLFIEATDKTGGNSGFGLAVIESWPEWMRDRVFAWRSRPNCFFCFFQRRYEWVGLLEHYPKLFAKAEEIENRIGHGDMMRRQSGFNWIDEDYPLSRIRENANAIFSKRLETVCDLLIKGQQVELFEANLDQLDRAGTSCGLLCGK